MQVNILVQLRQEHCTKCFNRFKAVSHSSVHSKLCETQSIFVRGSTTSEEFLKFMFRTGHCKLCNSLRFQTCTLSRELASPPFNRFNIVMKHTESTFLMESSVSCICHHSIYFLIISAAGFRNQ